MLHKSFGNSRLTRLAAVVGLMGVTCLVVGTSLALHAYRGPFTLLNLTISELGLFPVSPWADVFNAALIIGGLCLALFLAGLGNALRGWSGTLIAVLGVCTGLATALVGVFPVDHPWHQIVGPLCFLSGLLTSVVFTARLLLSRTPIMPRWLAFPSGLVIAGIGLYMSMPLLLPDGVNQVFAAPDASLRPMVWSVAISEWLAFGAVLLWSSLTAGYMLYRTTF